MRNTNPKLAIVYDAIYPFVKGGAEKRNYEISKRLAKRGYEVHIYGMKLWQGKDILKKEGVYLHGICKKKELYTTGGRRSIWQALYFGLNCFKLLKEDFDILDVDHMPFFSLFSTKIVTLLKRKPLHATWNEVWGRKYWNIYLKKIGIFAYFIEYISARLPDKIIAVSEHTKADLINELGVKKEIFVVPNGIDLNEIQSVSKSSEKSDILFAGRLLSHKNVDFLINAVKNLTIEYPQIKAIIVGDGPEKIKLNTQIKKLKLEKHIKLTGFLEDHKKIYSLMKSSKVFVLPSTREGFGMVVLEANACGIPVITTNHKNNASKSLIQDKKNGLLTALDSKSISNSVKFLLTHKQPKSFYKNFSKNYDWNSIVDNLKNIYQ